MEQYSLSRFTTRTPLNAIIADNMVDVYIMQEGGGIFEARAYKCFNNAYYICKQVVSEDIVPLYKLPDFFKHDAQWNEQEEQDVIMGAVTMSIVYILLEHYDKRWVSANQPFLDKIEERFGNMYIPSDLSMFDGPFIPAGIRSACLSAFYKLRRNTDIDYTITAEEFILEDHGSNTAITAMQQDNIEENIVELQSETTDSSIADNNELASLRLQLQEIKEKNAKLEEERNELQEQVDHFHAMERGTALGLNQRQAALFGLSLARTYNFQFTNMKKDLAPMLHGLFGWGESKLAVCLSTPCEKEEQEELANLFKDLSPDLYNTILKRGEPQQNTTSEVTP